MTEKKTVLLVDDDPLIIQTYQTEFELSNFNVLKAGDGQSGLALAEKEKPNAILLDILMPMISGLDVLRRLKKNSETLNIPVFVLTNIGHEETIKEAMDIGAIDFILKYRYTPAEVVTKVRQVLQP